MTTDAMRVTRWLSVALLLCAVPTQAQRFEGPLGGDSNRPWATGVSAEDQQAAQALFREGNDHLRESVFVEAIRSYRRALGHWNHPAIHYNLALALMNLDQPIEVHKHLQSAMRHGVEPLDAGRFEHARAYQALIEQQLTWVDIACDEVGAVVTLNGQPLFTAPGRFQGLIRPGTHSIVALKEGYLSTEKRQALMPGEKVTFHLDLFTEEQVIRYRRRWSTWVPWAVLGTGLAIAGGGGVMHSKAEERFRAFDARIPATGAPLSSELSSLRRQGSRLQGAAIGAYSLGGAVLLSGAIMLYLNRRESYRITPETNERFTAAPFVSAGSRGLLGEFRF
ncbi:hypothetical protein LY474_37365 [Myxococcus stipitatus]|uniref:hypothetical protein n=1 Tax=Myxococcus stipitatus TaxID=83455 RepID=UPI001F45EFE5|nr:hypothetical protein [Myxococcus stipitatus]MCE9673492.1 hypothetical protein [Myxococcus stipitatus]